MKKPLIFSSLIFFFALAYLVLSPGCSGSGSSSSKTNMFKDADGDGYGDSASVKEFKTSKLALDSATGFSTVTDDDGSAYTSNGNDCDDTDAAVSPGDSEVAGDGVDNNCDGTIDEEEGGGGGEGDENEATDDDGDGYTEAAGDCDDSNNAISPGATETAGDGINSDCDDEGLDNPTTDADGDGITSDSDCNDNDSSVGAATTYYLDSDGDGYGTDSGSEGSSTTSCESSLSGYASTNTDCDDSNASVNPGVSEGFFYGNGDGNSLRGSTGFLYRYEFIRTAHAAGGDDGDHGDDIDNDCDGTVDESDCDCESLGLGHDHGNYTTSSLLNRFDFIRSAHAADGDGDTSSEYYSADCAAQIDTFKSLSPSHYDCVSTTDTPAPTTPTSIDWGVTTVWRGAAWQWKTECDTSSTDNLTYGGIKSYITSQDPTISSGSAKNDFEIATMLDHDPDNIDYQYKTYWTTIAYNKEYMRTYSNHVNFTCGNSAGNDSYYSGTQGKCEKSVEIDLVNTAGMEESWVEEDNKSAFVVLRGFSVNYDENGNGGNDQIEFGDAYVATGLTDSNTEDHKITLKVTVDFNGETGTNDYATYAYYTVFVYDTSKITHTYFEIDDTSAVASHTSTWDSADVRYEHVTTKTISSSILPSSKNNTFIGLKAWGESGEADAFQFHKATLYSTMDSWSSGTATVKTNGIFYKDACGTESAQYENPDDSAVRVITCSGDTICKAVEDYENWNSVSASSNVSETIGRDDTVSSLPTTE